MKRLGLPEVLSRIEPMLLTELKRPFNDPEWVFELKYDGYRLMTSVGTEGVHLKTRGGAAATGWFPETVSGLRALELPSGDHVFDGEVCVLDEHGRTDFELLHERARARRWKPGLAGVVYCVFDLLVDGGRDIRRMPLAYRRDRLADLLPTPSDLPLLRVGGFVGEGVWLFQQAVSLELEGIVAKRLDSPYEAGRSPSWVKVKRKGATSAQRFSRPPRADL